MKIQILSDLHLEFASFDVQRADADVLVLAGNTHLGNHGVEWAARSGPTFAYLAMIRRSPELLCNRQ